MRDYGVKIKYFIYQHYFIIILIILGIAVSSLIFCFWNQINDFGILFTIIGGLVSFFYFVQKQQLEELQAFKTLFTEFNDRYDQMNETLNRIVKKEQCAEELSPEDKVKLYDYFNLCGEEHLFYKKGYIYPEVWKAWCNGMAYYLRCQRIGELWNEEEKSGSYYGLTRKEITRHGSK